MQKQKVIKILILALVLIAPLFLGGCQKKCPKPTENIPGTSTFREDCLYEDVLSDEGKLKELDFYFVYDNTDAFREQIQAFQSRNPGVVVRTKKFVDLKEYEDLVINEIAEGEGPDVFMLHNSWITKHQKKLMPMPLGLSVNMTPELFRQTFFQAASEDLIIDEKIYGMPMSLDNLAIFYNKPVFKDLLATTDHPAQLWEDIKEQAFQLTKRDNSPERFALAGIALGRADNIGSAVDILCALMLQYGTAFYDDKEERAIFAGSQTGDVSKPGVMALELFTSFALPSYKHYSWNETITGRAPEEMDVGAFVRGKVAMIIGYPYLYEVIQSSIQTQQKLGQKHIDLKDVGVAPFPQLVSPTETARRDTLASYFPLVVSRTSDMPDEAWSFVQFMTTADALQTYYKKTKRPTSRKDMVTEQQTDAMFGAFAFQAPFAKTLRVYDTAAYQKALGDAIQEVVRNLATPEQALKTAEDKITCVIRKQKGLAEAEEDCGV
ncbi:MAG: extracellular solute-binding protein [Candidatus Peregrinibacteria bacterium]